MVEDGHVLTSAGISAGIDMALRVVARYHGEAVARNTARDHGVPLFGRQLAARLGPSPGSSARGKRWTARSRWWIARAWAARTSSPPEDARRLHRPLVLAAAPIAALEPRAERPVYSVGEQWLLKDGVYELTKIEKNRYIWASTPGRQIHLTKDLALVSVLKDRVWERDVTPLPEIAWPLEVGKWGLMQRVTLRMRSQSSGVPVRLGWQVKAYEDVRVVGGLFKAVQDRLHRESRFRRPCSGAPRCPARNRGRSRRGMPPRSGESSRSSWCPSTRSTSRSSASSRRPRVAAAAPPAAAAVPATPPPAAAPARPAGPAALPPATPPARRLLSPEAAASRSRSPRRGTSSR